MAGKRQYLSAKYNYTYIQFSLTAEAAKLYFAIIEGKQLVENAEQKHNNAKIIYDLYVKRMKAREKKEQAIAKEKALIEKKRLEEELKMTKELEKQDEEKAREDLKNLIKVR